MSKKVKELEITTECVCNLSDDIMENIKMRFPEDVNF